MTTTEKNKCIAEMLGWKTVQIPIPDFDNKVASSPYRVMEDRWEHPVSKTLYKCLKFDTDANWQFEAIDWIEKEHYCTFEIQSDFIGITAFKERKLSYWVIINKYPQDKMGMKPEDLNPFEAIEFDNYESSRREAIFKALYEFSKYIKGNGSK